MAPRVGSWAQLPFVPSPPAPRADAAGVWTGAEVLVFGGTAPEATPSQGYRYSPATGQWRLLPSAGEPSPRTNPFAVWTGSQFLVWGGYSGGQPLSDGALYDPVLDRWGPVSPIPIQSFQY